MKLASLVQIVALLAATFVIGGTGAAVAQTTGAATAQTTPAPSSMKTIGTPTAALKPEIVPSLFVINSRGATLHGDTLTLTDISPSSIILADILADRPIRAAGHQSTADVIAEWGSGDDVSPRIRRTPPFPS